MVTCYPLCYLSSVCVLFSGFAFHFIYPFPDLFLFYFILYSQTYLFVIFFFSQSSIHSQISHFCHYHLNSFFSLSFFYFSFFIFFIFWFFDLIIFFCFASIIYHCKYIFNAYASNVSKHEKYTVWAKYLHIDCRVNNRKNNPKKQLKRWKLIICRNKANK